MYSCCGSVIWFYGLAFLDICKTWTLKQHVMLDSRVKIHTNQTPWSKLQLQMQYRFITLWPLSLLWPLLAANYIFILGCNHHNHHHRRRRLVFWPYFWSPSTLIISRHWSSPVSLFNSKQVSTDTPRHSCFIIAIISLPHVLFTNILPSTFSLVSYRSCSVYNVNILFDGSRFLFGWGQRWCWCGRGCVEVVWWVCFEVLMHCCPHTN